MYTALALSLQLLCGSNLPEVGPPDDSPWRLVAQASVSRETELRRRIEDLNDRIRAFSTDWPTLSVVGAYAGFSAAGAFVLPGLLLVVIGIATPGAGPALLLSGLVAVVLGAVGLVIGIISVVGGLAAQAEAKEKRAVMIRERDDLQEELRNLRSGSGPAGVERLDSGSHLITVATF